MAANVNFDVHRLRIGQWQPTPIRSIAVSPSNLVAIGREDGEIEILEPEDKFVQVVRVTGASDFKLQGLCWSKHNVDGDERLFGISLRGFIFEVDFSTLSLKNICDTYSGAAWSVAAHPRDDIIAVGGEDGAVRFFKYTSNGKLDYFKTLPSSGTRVLSLCFHPRLPAIYMGCSDGTIRCFDENNNRALLRMSGDIHYGLNFTPSIWALKVLSDSTVVTGDSTGQVQIWDGNAGVLTTSFRQHEADVLSLAISADEHAIFASGVDGKVICLELPHSASLGALSGDWVYTHSHRSHSHDVFALAVCRRPRDLEHIPGQDYVLLSGGLDAKLCMYAADQSDFSRQRPYYLPISPANQQLVTSSEPATSTTSSATSTTSSSTSMLIAINYRRHIDLWTFNPQLSTASNSSATTSSSSGSSSGAGKEQACSLAARLQWTSAEHLHCASISHRGNMLLAAINHKGIKAWRINNNNNSNSNTANTSSSSGNAGKHALQLQKLRNLPQVFEKLNATAISFAYNDAFLAVYSAEMHAVLLFTSAQQRENLKNKPGKKATPAPADGADGDDFAQYFNVAPVTLRLAEESHEDSNSDPAGAGSSSRRFKNKLFFIVRAIKFSPDNKFLAVAHASDHVTIFDISRPTPAVHWRLRPFPATVAELQFLSDDRLLVLPSDNLLQVFDVKKLVFLSHPTTSSNTTSNNNTSNNTTSNSSISPSSTADSSANLNSNLIPRQVSRGLYFPLAGVASASAGDDRMLFYGPMQCVYVDLNLPVPAFPLMVGGKHNQQTSTTGQQLQQRNEHTAVSFNEEEQAQLQVEVPAKGKKSKRKKADESEVQVDTSEQKRQKVLEGAERDKPNPNFAIIENYRNILHVRRLPRELEANGRLSLVVIENPWFRFAEQLPDTLARKRYGT